MPWAKIDDGLHANEKFAAVSLGATGLWTLCLSWTTDKLKDGFVPTAMVNRLGGRDGQDLAAELVEAGLWDEAEGGYRFTGRGGIWEVGTPRDDSYRAHQDAVFARDGHACVYCGSPMNLTLDHVIPQSRGGSHDAENLVTACRSCNSSKGAKTPAEWEASRRVD